MRLVNRRLCTAASTSLLYPSYATYNQAQLERSPPFAAKMLVFISASSRNETRILDLAPLSGRFPRLEYFDTFETDVVNMEDLPASLVGLDMIKMQVRDLESLSHLTRLDYLQLGSVDEWVPAASLASLRVLRLFQQEGNLVKLMRSLAASACAASLESLCLIPRTALPARWWTPLANLLRLRELDLCLTLAPSTHNDEDNNGFATLLASLDSLSGLALRIPFSIARAVLRHGLPSSLHKLRFRASRGAVGLARLVPILPRGLRELEVYTSAPQSAADLAALLAQCPELHTLDVSCDDDAIDLLVAEAGQRPPMLLGDSFRDKAAQLEAAGHSLGHFLIEIALQRSDGIL